jgi:hypothetical protein
VTTVAEAYAKDFILIFTSILYEALPFIILGAVIAGFLEEMVPQQLLARFIPRSRGLAIAMGGLLGLIFPMCECGIVPVMRRLLRKGLPLSCCIAYMLAGPIINVVVMLSTLAAFSGMEELTIAGRPAHQFGGPAMVGLRVGLGFLVAFGTSVVVEWQYRHHGNRLLTPLAMPPRSAAAVPDPAALPSWAEPHAAGRAAVPAGNPGHGPAAEPRRPWWQRLGNISETALHDFVDITVFLILGALLAALSRTVLMAYQIDIGALAHTLPLVAIAAMMGLAILLCLCSEADAFVAASFVTLPPAAKLAFLVLGPMLDFKLYMMFTRVFRPRLIWTIIACVVVQVFLYTSLVHFAWQAYVASVAPTTGSP